MSAVKSLMFCGILLFLGLPVPVDPVIYIPVAVDPVIYIPAAVDPVIYIPAAVDPVIYIRYIETHL